LKFRGEYKQNYDSLLRHTDRWGITFTPAASGLRVAEIIHYARKSIILTGCS
jgi:hypothetical protein